MRIVAQVSLPSVLWMVSPVTALEDMGQPRPVTNSKQGTRGSVLLAFKRKGSWASETLQGSGKRV